MFDAVSKWHPLRTLKYNDADVALAATSATIDIPLPQGLGGTHVLLEEVIYNGRTAFAGNAGTCQLDVGISGATEQHLKDVDMKAASGTKALGSGTTSVKPNVLVTATASLRLTITSGSGNLSTLNAGVGDVLIKLVSVPPLNA